MELKYNSIKFKHLRYLNIQLSIFIIEKARDLNSFFDRTRGCMSLQSFIVDFERPPFIMEVLHKPIVPGCNLDTF
jgi:hypothetical protein